MIAAPGYERIATDRILAATSGWTRDRAGNLMKRSGSGSPRRVIACGIDETGYVVSEITADGYLRVHMNGNGRHPQLWDQYHEGQRVIVLAVDRANSLRSRHVPGVFAVRSNHLWRRRVNDETPATIENLWIDIGARSRADAERMGIAVLDPVVRDWPEWAFGSYVAGPAASSRAGCAAVAAAGTTNNRAAEGETVLLISTQKSFNWAGLTAAIAGLGGADSVIIVDPSIAPSSATVSRQNIRAPWPAAAAIRVGSVSAISMPARFPGTLAESVRESDIQALFLAVVRAAGQSGNAPSPIRLAHGWAAAPPLVVRDSLSQYADMLGRLTDIYAVSGHEEPMRSVIQAALPKWARESAVVDSAGNLVLAMGPNRDTTVVVAHMDEIGFLVTQIARDGTLSLRVRGSFFPFMWEGQPALLHRPGDKPSVRDGRLGCDASREGPMRGVFAVRDSASDREPANVTAWFGLDSAELVAAGVKVGSPLSGFKCSARLGDVRLTARSVDDRAGVTSLLLALDEIEPSKLDHKVIFVWSVREEGGLEGAKAAAAIFGPSVHRVHAVDTFVSSDSPVESRRFGYAPIGQGAVVRALDNSSVTPPDEIERVTRIARGLGIPLQVGVTNGGNDGSEFARFGAADVALAWPLRYSHSPAEVIDLRDLRSLARIVAAVSKAPTSNKPPVTPNP
ncbi:MAG TPA: M20/M25/M40 family metallo-hydrolase [Candidatus Limnocylindrales bacterium]|nr:M20/M25/M40 family metallo-hydrolase [Candidatus Limnocylindrales bacterium]